MGGEPTENSRPRHCKVWRVIWLPKIYVVPEAMFDKMQAYPNPNNVKEMQAFVGILGLLEDFYFPPGTVPLPFIAQ